MGKDSSSRARVFLSYARRDGEAADRIFEALVSAGIDVFRDSKDILPAEDWRARLAGLIAAADAMLFLLSPNSAASEVCAWELETAARLNKRLVPMVVERVPEGAAPAELERLNYIFATPGDDLGVAIAAVGSAVDTDIDWVREHTRLYERAVEWEKHGARARLLAAEPLEAAERWLAAQPDAGPAPLPVHRAWIAASRRAATRRQRAWVIGSLAVAGVAIGLGVFAEINRQIAAAQRDRAERILDRGSKTANDLVFDLAQRFRDREGVPQDLVLDILGRSKNLVDQFAEFGEGRPDLLRSRAASLTELSLTLLRQDDLDGALAAAEEAIEGFGKVALLRGDTPEVRADLAVSHDRLGDVHFSLGDLGAAGKHFRRSLALNEALAESDPSAARQTNLIVAHEKLGALALALDEGAAALARFEEALAIAGDDPDIARQTAILTERRGDSHLLLGKVGPALSAYKESLRRTAALAATDPGDTRLQRDLSVIHQKLGDLLMAEQRTDEALRHFRADLAIVERLRNSDPDRLDWLGDQIVSQDRLGVALYRSGDSKGAEQALAKAWEAAAQRAGRDADHDAFRSATAKAAQKLALVAFGNGRPERSLAVARTTAEHLDAHHRATGRMAQELADALNNVAWYALFSDDPSTSIAPARRALELVPGMRGYRLNLAHALMLSDDPDAALAIHGVEAEGGGADWRALVATDFEAFRQAGIDTPAMGLVEALLAE